MRRLALMLVLFALGHALFAPLPTLAKETDEERPIGSLGGAVHADPFTGVATTSIPIEVPPGRNGMQPNLQLVYNSSSGNGWVGMGWELEQEGIFRQTKWGVDYSNNTGDKAFTVKMSGVSGDLVQTPPPAPSTQWSANIEGGFSRIEQLTASDGQIMWKVTTKQGRKHYFGQTSASRQVDPANASRIFGWLLDRVEDLDGNYLMFSYWTDTTNNQIYLDQILYTGNTVAGISPNNTVKFWLDDGSRPDQAEMYTTNYRIMTKYRLKTVEIRGNGKLVRAYNICYLGNASPCPTISGSSMNSLLTAVQQFGQDAVLGGTGLITGGSSFPASQMTYTTNVQAFSNSSWLVVPGWAGSSLPMSAGDFNGDGKSDLLVEASGQWYVGTSTGSSFSLASWLYVPGWVGSPLPMAAGDFNGDGKSDVVIEAYQSGQFYSATSQGTLQNAVPNLLMTLSNGIGGKTTVQYDTSANDAANRVPFAVQRAKNITSCDTWNASGSPPTCAGTASTTTYSYSGGFYQIGERDLRGVNKTTVTSPAGPNGEQTITETWFHQGNDVAVDTNDPTGSTGYTKGLPYRTKVSQVASAGATPVAVSETTTSYLSDPDGIAPWFTPPAIVTTSIYDNTGVLAKQTQTESVSYDAYGNLTLAYNRGDFTDNNAITSDDTTMAVTYGNYDTTNWFVAFPTVSTTYAGLGQTGANGVIVSQTKYYYDGAGGCTAPAGNPIPTRGHVTKVERYLDQGGSNPISGMEYNAYGSLSCSRDPLGNVTTLAYDPTGTFPLTSTNALGHVTTTSYYGVNGVPMDTGLYGQVKSVTDPNTQTTTSTYDPLGRKLTTTTPDGLVTTLAYNYGGTFSVGTQNMQTTVSGGGLTANLVSKTYFDGLGRTIRTEKPGAADGGASLKVLVTETQYDNRGLVKQTSLPYLQGTESATGRWKTMTYDALGRLIQSTNPDGTSSRVCYNVWTTTTIDPKQHKKVETKDAFGRLVTVQEYIGTDSTTDCSGATPYTTNPTAYTYNLAGNLLSVTDTKGNVSVMTYDTLGRKLTMQDPDMGNWSYSYDANGNLLQQTDAKNQMLCFQYDALNRRTQKNYGTTTQACGTNTIVYSYDDPVAANNGKGRLKQVTDPAQSVTFQYDSRGRITQSAKTLDGTTYTTTSTYDGLGRLTSVNYPTTPITTVTYAYDGPQLKQVSEGSTTYVTYGGWNALGQPAAATYGNGVATTMTYADLAHPTCVPANSFKLCMLQTQLGTSPRYQDLRYDYEANGNVWNIYDATVANNAGDQHFSYDDLDRLTVANGPYGASGANASLLYAYDEIGNMTFNPQLGTYSYPTSGPGRVRPHGVTATDSYSLSYDANGNVTAVMYTSGATLYAATYDAENRLTSMYNSRGTPQNTTFVYDGDGGRVKKIGDTTTTRYISKLYECDNTSCSRFIWAGSTRIASVAVSNGTVTYWHGDHLGSSSVITDAAGNQVEAITYYPYGATRTNQSFTTPVIDVPYKYTGKELDASTGLYYYEARYYQPWFARFFSADTIVPNPRDPQSLNRYSYVGNNPLRYTDPSGHRFLGSVGKFFSSPVGRAIGWAVCAMCMQFVDPATRNYTVPVAAGVVGTFACGPVCGGAAAGAARAGLAQSDGRRGNILRSTIAGAVGGLAGGVANLAVPGDMVMAGIAGGAVNGAVNSAIGGGSVLQGALMGGTIGALTGYYNSQGIIDRTSGPIWNGPNTLIGGGYLILNGVASIPSLLTGGPGMDFSFGDGGIQITNAPLVSGAVTLGHFMLYGGYAELPAGVQGPPEPYLPTTRISSYTGQVMDLGEHEGGHIPQGQVMGPLFLPTWALFGGPIRSNPFEIGADNYGTGTGSVWSGF